MLFSIFCTADSITASGVTHLNFLDIISSSGIDDALASSAAMLGLVMGVLSYVSASSAIPAVLGLVGVAAMNPIGLDEYDKRKKWNAD